MKTEKQKMISGEAYVSSDPELVSDRKRAKDLVRQQDLRALIPNAPESLIVEFPFHCDYGTNIFCGENVFFNFNCVVLDVTAVTIGSNVFFGPGVQLYTADHPRDYLERRRVESGKPITIGDDCWFGGGAIVLPGVRIGDRCIIGAGAVVTKDVPSDSVVAGNPATVIKRNS